MPIFVHHFDPNNLKCTRHIPDLQKPFVIFGTVNIFDLIALHWGKNTTGFIFTAFPVEGNFP